MITLPGLIDPHVHFRTPGQSHKEDFTTGTMAALAGGFTAVLDMPNNSTPITTFKLLKEKMAIAKKQIVCDAGFYLGSLGKNFDEFKKIEGLAFGIKIYLNQTTGGFIVDEKMFAKICEQWNSDLPILLHAESDVIEKAIEIGHKSKSRIHICHISSQKELETVLNAKLKGYDLTCGVTPHHLFLTESNVEKLGSFAMMKPSLKSKKDQNFLWSHLADIDIIESDHAPHTFSEKKSNKPPFGCPGLETTLSLLLTACSQDKLSIDDIVRLCHDGPAKIFHVDQDAYIEIDENEKWTVKKSKLFTKCKWSPFNKWEMTGRVKRVFIRGKKVFENGKILVKPGFARLLTPDLAKS